MISDSSSSVSSFPFGSYLSAPTDIGGASRVPFLSHRLAQLVKLVKRRDLAPEPSHTLDRPAGLEAEIRTWLENLPPPWRLGIDANLAEENTEDDDIHVLVAQRCELAITAQKLVLRLYMPFLRPSCMTTATSSTSTLVPHQASHGAINAAHVILHACKTLYICRKRAVTTAAMAAMPAVFDFHTFGRTVFDAAVVCAHSAIKQPTVVWAGAALENVSSALEVLCGLAAADDVRDGDLPVEDAMKIVEALKRKAETAREAGVPGGAGWMGMKRKHGEVECEVGVEVGLNGLQFSFVTPPARTTNTKVAASDTQQHRERSPRIPLTLDVAMERVRAKYETPKEIKEKERAREKEMERQKEKEKEKGSKHAKKNHYPPVGIRVRPGKEGSPIIRQRTGSGSTATTTTTTSSPGDGAMIAAPSLQSPMSSLPRKNIPSQPSTPLPNDGGFHQQQQTINHDMAQDPSVYHQPVTSAQDNPMPLSMPQETDPNTNMDYSLGYGGEGHQINMEPLHRRRFSIHDPVQTSHSHTQPPQQQYSSFSNSATRIYDPPQGGDFERSHATSFDPSHPYDRTKSFAVSPSSYVPSGGGLDPPPEQSSDTNTAFANGSGSMSSSSLSSANFGPGPGLSTHHTGTPTYGGSLGGGDTYYMSTGYESEYASHAMHGHAQAMPMVGLGMTAATTQHSMNMASSVSSNSHYDKTSQPVYDLKPPDHHSRPMQQQQQYQVSHGHDPSCHHPSSHGISHAPPPPPQQPSWSQATSGGDYWSGPNFKYYHQ